MFEVLVRHDAVVMWQPQIKTPSVRSFHGLSRPPAKPECVPLAGVFCPCSNRLGSHWLCGGKMQGECVSEWTILPFARICSLCLRMPGLSGCLA